MRSGCRRVAAGGKSLLAAGAACEKTVREHRMQTLCVCSRADELVVGLSEEREIGVCGQGVAVEIAGVR